MKEYKIIIEPMGKSITDKSQQNRRFVSFEIAKAYFLSLCEENNILFEAGDVKGSFDVGGIGFDYRITFETYEN